MVDAHVSPALRNCLPHPLREPILDQAGKNHQILGRRQKLFPNFLPRVV